MHFYLTTGTVYFFQFPLKRERGWLLIHHDVFLSFNGCVPGFGRTDTAVALAFGYAREILDWLVHEN